MYQIDSPTAAAAQPASTPAGTAGFFTDGNPAGGVAATILSAEWLNAMMMELLNVLSASGIAPAKNQFNQLLSSLKGSFAPVAGDARNARMSVAAASSIATFAADEVVVKTALGGQPFVLSSFSQSINLATTGAGGMDTGSPPVNGYVGIYAGFNPTTGQRTVWAQNATSAVMPEVYSGANMPAAYTASALVAVWPTNGSGQLQTAKLNGRVLSRIAMTVVNNTSLVGPFTPVNMASAIPQNARRAKMLLGTSNTTISTVQTIDVASDVSGSGQQSIVGNVILSGNGSATNATVDIPTAQTMYYKNTNNGGGTPTFVINVTGYEI